MGKKILIEYCAPCGFEKAAKTLESELKTQFADEIEQITLQPSKLIGKFDVVMDGEIIFDKRSVGHLPLPGEIETIIIQKNWSKNK